LKIEAQAPIYDHSYSYLSPSLWQSIFKIEAHEEEPPSVNWPQQYQEEEYQSQFVANYNGQYMEEECTYYCEQTTTTPRNEETVEKKFCEPSLEDLWESALINFVSKLWLKIKWMRGKRSKLRI
jgi:hypothetical protein